MSTPNFELRQSYSFQLYPAALLGNDYENVTVMAILDFETANLSGLDAQARHVQVYPSLPAGTPNDPAQYSYVKLRRPNGSITILGLPWIKPETVTQVTSSTITVKISGVAAADLARVRACLVQNGFGNIALSIS